jgi:hypothetical protein
MLQHLQLLPDGLVWTLAMASAQPSRWRCCTTSAPLPTPKPTPKQPPMVVVVLGHNLTTAAVLLPTTASQYLPTPLYLITLSTHATRHHRAGLQRIVRGGDLQVRFAGAQSTEEVTQLAKEFVAAVQADDYARKGWPRSMYGELLAGQPCSRVAWLWRMMAATGDAWRAACCLSVRPGGKAGSVRCVCRA